MMKISCILVLSSVLYGVWACDPKATAPFKANAMNLTDFIAMKQNYYAVSSNASEIHSASIEHGAKNPDNSVTSLFKAFDAKGAVSKNFTIRFVQERTSDETRIWGTGYWNDPNQVNSYFSAKCGDCQATLVCNDKNYVSYSILYFVEKICSDEDYKACEKIIEESNSLIPIRKLPPPP